MHFEWDAAKGLKNLHKDGVSFEEAASVFYARWQSRALTPITPKAKKGRSPLEYRRWVGFWS